MFEWTACGGDAALIGAGEVVRSVRTPEFDGITFHEVLAKSALNRVPGNAMPFDWTINPYRGCTHACLFCVSPDTLVLCADGRQRPIGELRVGDEVYGTQRRGAYRRYVLTTVRAAWRTRKRAYRVRLADGTELVASGDHRFLTDRGWKYVTGAMSGPNTRPFLTLNNRLLGFGLPALERERADIARSQEYQRGYLTGMIRGDGSIFRGEYAPRTGGGSRVTSFRLALADQEALDRSRQYLAEAGIATRSRPFLKGSDAWRPMNAIHTAKAADVAAVEALIDWPDATTGEWDAGYVAGLFDAEGSCSDGVLRIANKDLQLLGHAQRALSGMSIPSVLEGPAANGVYAVRVTGGQPVRSRFFHHVQPAITRKLSIEGRAVKTVADLRVIEIEDLGSDIEMVDITTGTGDFIANGVVSHNCFARRTHEYLDFDAGKDFDSEIVVKLNVVEVLERELAKPSWKRERVALGTNTDPYQRAEGRYRLMPGIIEALAGSGTPFSILTKGTLLRRDLELLQRARQRVPLDVAMTIDVFDPELQPVLEPGAPSTPARLATVRALADAGIDSTVFVMPILPYLTDSKAHLDRAFGEIAASGAVGVAWSALHLKPGAREWFMGWLERDHPELVGRYRSIYPNGQVYAPAGYRRWLAQRVRPLLSAHGLDREKFRSPKSGELPPQTAVALQPTLF